eukprot:scaffold362317_cov47-Prasinocladus_malaysianus.AAC.1
MSLQYAWDESARDYLLGLRNADGLCDNPLKSFWGKSLSPVYCLAKRPYRYDLGRIKWSHCAQATVALLIVPVDSATH